MKNIIPDLPDIRIELATASSYGSHGTVSTIIHSQESSVKPRKRKRKGSEAKEKPGGGPWVDAHLDHRKMVDLTMKNRRSTLW